MTSSGQAGVVVIGGGQAGVVVIGGGQAANAFIAKFRQSDSETRITLIGDEAFLPYQRPPLSKKYLSGDMSLDQLLLRPADWYEKHGVILHRGVVANKIDREAKRVFCEGGLAVDYDSLVLTMGARARALPDAVTGGAVNIYCLRNIADIDAIRLQWQAGRHLLVVGGGYIGLEAAAMARKSGLRVTLIEAGERILGRVASVETADFFCKLHEAHGVDVRQATGLESFIFEDGHIDGKNDGKNGGRITGARLSDGSEIAVDIVIVGIGIVPCDELARDAGLGISENPAGGILVDGETRTSDAAIFAAGDCAVFSYQGVLTRLESVQNAINQAEHTALVLLGRGREYVPSPWFWSDQYDVKLQIAGLNRGYDSVVVRAGKAELDGGMRAQSVWYYRRGDFCAVDSMNDSLAYAIGKKLLETGKAAPVEIIGDAGADLKSLR